MAEISIDIDRENDLSTITIDGILEENDLPDTLAKYFADGPTQNTLYDSTKGDWSKNSAEYYRAMICASKSFSRAGARVAMVFGNTTDFGIGRMLESYCEQEGYLNDYACFRSPQAARDWLSQAAGERILFPQMQG